MNSSLVSSTHSATLRFSWYDYIIFVTMLVISTSIGIYYGCFGTKQRTLKEYLFGDKSMRPLPVAVSIAVGHFTAIMLVAMPTEIYKYGAFFFWLCPCFVLLAFISICVLFPVFFNLQLTSIYEYLELRFDKKTRMLASFFYILSQLFKLSLFAYTPALALAAATGFHVNLISSVTCAICVFYTTIGGLKAVVWTDFIQLFIIMISLVTICGIGFSSSGVASIWNKALEGGRLDIFDFDLNPTKRDTFWTYLLGHMIHWTYFISLSQSGLQKFLAVPTFRDCVWTTVYFTICMNLVVLLVVTIGLLLYARYSNCDLLLSNKIEKLEQMVPYYVMDIAGNIPTISGFFIVTIFCASLSTISSSLNALSGVIYKDFVSNFWKVIPEKRVTSVLKLIVAATGTVCIALVLMLRHLGDVVPLMLGLSGIVDGPSMGLFTLGLLFPKANATGTFYGGIVTFMFLASLAVITKVYQYEKLLGYPSKVLSTDRCGTILSNMTKQENASFLFQAPIASNTTHLPLFLFRISPASQCLFGVIITVVLGLLFSYVTKGNSVDKSLISPISRFMLPEDTEMEEPELQTFIQSQDKKE